MKTLTLLAIIAGLSTAEADVAVRVTSAGSRKAESAASHVFCGRATEFSVDVGGTPENTIRASLYQLAGSIAAPFIRDVAVVPGGANGEAVFKVDLSSVQKVTAMELSFTVQNPGDATPRSAGSSRVIVYPDDLVSQAKKLLVDAGEKVGLKLVILGESPRLKAILRDGSIAFDEADSVGPSSRGSRAVFLGEADSARARTLIEQAPPASALMLFTEDFALPPGVYWTQRGGGFVAKITLPVLPDFEHAPERQMLFLTLIQRALETPSALP